MAKRVSCLSILEKNQMKLPNTSLARVDREKIIEYLLNAEHRFGASKARFFASFGFNLMDWEVLAQALKQHGQQNNVRNVRQTLFGPRYEVDGELNAADGRRPRIRTVWQMDRGEVAPRLITAYPLEANND